MRSFSSYHNIKIDGDEYTSGFLGLDWFPSTAAAAQKQRYETDIVASLERLADTWSGWAVFTEIFYRSRTMTIRPFHPTKQTGPINAYAQATDTAAATLKDTAERGNDGNVVPGGVVGTGTGSDTVVRFSKETWTGPTAPAGAGASPDEILLHEMIHGLRQMQGRSVRESVNGNPGMDNYEEFAAITISNIYRSEKGIPGLRRDHQDFSPLSGPATDPAVFKSTYGQYLSFMDIEQPRLCKNLRQINCPFNPLKF
jgi:Effector protein